MEVFGKIVGIILLTALTIFVGAWAFSTLWSWFIVPIGVPAIGYAHAYGLMIVASFLKMRPKDFDTSSDTVERKSFGEHVTRFFMCILFYLVAVGMGWLTLLFM